MVCAILNGEWTLLLEAAQVFAGSFRLRAVLRGRAHIMDSRNCAEKPVASYTFCIRHVAELLTTVR